MSNNHPPNKPRALYRRRPDPNEVVFEKDLSLSAFFTRKWIATYLAISGVILSVVGLSHFMDSPKTFSPEQTKEAEAKKGELSG